MEVGLGARVECVDGEDGRVSGLIVERESLRLVGLVVTRDGLIPRDVVVPMAVVRNAEAQRIYVRVTLRELWEQHHSLRETDYAPMGDDWELPPPDSPEELVVTSLPAVGSEPPLIPLQSDLKRPFLRRELTGIPEGALAITGFTQILCPDGSVGNLEGILFEPSTGDTQHIVARLNPPSRMLVVIPQYLIDYAEENEVYVKARRSFLESLAA